MGGSVDLEDADYVIFKGADTIDAADLAQLDVLYVFEDENNADFVIIDKAMVAGTLTEGSGDSITVGDNDYDIAGAKLNLEGGVDGDYNAFDLADLEDAWDTDVQLALKNVFEALYVIGDVNATSSVYGIVTDISLGGLKNNKVIDVTILNQTGEEVTYDVADDALTFQQEDDDAQDTDIELGSYVEVALDSDGVIDHVKLDDSDDEIIIAADSASDDDACDISGSKINIDDKWYKVNDATLIFETVTVDGHAYVDSDSFDEANLIDVADLLDADDVEADDIYIASADGATLERLFIVNSTLTMSDEGYSFLDKLYTNSSGDYVKMLDGTVAEQSDDDYEDNVLYSYVIKGGELNVTPLVTFPAVKTAPTTTTPVEDGYWVLNGGIIDKVTHAKTLDDIDLVVGDFDGETLTLDGKFYEFTSDTVVYTVDATGAADLGDDGDIDKNDIVMAISDEDANLMCVIVIADGAHIGSVTSDEFVTTIGDDTVTITLTGGTFKAGEIAASDFTLTGTDAAVLAAGTFTRSSDTVVTITGLGVLAGGDDNTVTVKAATMATQATAVTVSSFAD